MAPEAGNGIGTFSGVSSRVMVCGARPRAATNFLVSLATDLKGLMTPLAVLGDELWWFASGLGRA